MDELVSVVRKGRSRWWTYWRKGCRRTKNLSMQRRCVRSRREKSELLIKWDFEGSAGVPAGGCHQFGAEVDRVRCGVGGRYTGVLGEANPRAFSRDISSGVRSCHISWNSHNEGASRDISSCWDAGQLSTSVTDWMSCRCRVIRICQCIYRLKLPMDSLIGLPSHGSVWTAWLLTKIFSRTIDSKKLSWSISNCHSPST